MQRSLILPSAVLFVSCSPVAQEPAADRDREAIADLIEGVEAANNAGNVEGWVGFFAPDFVYMVPGSPAVTDVGELTDVARAGFMHQAAIQIEPEEIEVLGDWAFARTRVSGTVTVHESGTVVPVDSKQLVIYRRGEDGSWRIARLISNANR